MGLAPYPWLERPAEVLAKMLNKLPGGILIYGPRGCGVFELASRLAAFAKSANLFSAETIPTFATS